eukprot:maker-scaffold_27-snap-gene-2.54-mRNA-1 protein AED:0.00 eAED:0.00 QI:20/1/1/1/1/1/2/90/324
MKTEDISELRNKENMSSETKFTKNGMSYKVLHENSSPIYEIYFVHANGFSKEAWLEPLEYLKKLNEKKFEQLRIILVDVRGQGESRVRISHISSWNPSCLGDDLKEVVEESTLNKGKRVVVGHSIGGTTSLYCQVNYPRTFSGMILVEPIMQVVKGNRLKLELLAGAALKRKRFFKSKESALKSFGKKRAFSTWTPKALENYVEYSLKEVPVEERFELSCHPLTEFEFYCCDIDLYFRLLAEGKNETAFVKQIMGENTVVPGLVEGDETKQWVSWKCFPEDVKDEHVTVKGAGHLVVMEKPKIVAEEIWKYFDHFEAKHQTSRL